MSNHEESLLEIELKASPRVIAWADGLLAAVEAIRIGQGSDKESARLYPVNRLGEVAAFVGVSLSTVKRAIALGDLQTVSVGTGSRASRRVTAEAVREWMTRTKGSER